MAKLTFGMTLLLLQRISAIPVTQLDFDARQFKQEFNQSVDRTRLVLVFSPT